MREKRSKCSLGIGRKDGLRWPLLGDPEIDLRKYTQVRSREQRLSKRMENIDQEMIVEMRKRQRVLIGTTVKR